MRKASPPDEHLCNLTTGEEAGIKSVELEVEGRFAYGWLAGEKGTHRLVRQSPFNAKDLRMTSFAAVEVMPVLGEQPDSSCTLCSDSMPLVRVRLRDTLCALPGAQHLWAPAHCHCNASQQGGQRA